MFVYVGGIPGVGKTTVIQKTVELARGNNFSLQSLNEKQILYQITGVKSLEEYAQLPREIRAEARRRIVAHLYEMDKEDPTTLRIRDDHFTAPNEDDSYWVRQLEDTDKIHMLAFVVIVAEPEIILLRRITRNFIPIDSNFFKLDAIVQHQKLEIQVASLQAEQLQIPLKILNNEGRVIQTATFLLEFLKKVTSR